MKKRTATRLAAVQAIFQLDASLMPAKVLGREFLKSWEEGDIEALPQGSIDKSFFLGLVEGVGVQKNELDQMIEPQLAADWKMERLDPVALSILRLGLYELLNDPATPKEVIIHEYLNVAHTFMPEDEVGFINKVLDSIAKIIRGS